MGEQPNGGNRPAPEEKPQPPLPPAPLSDPERGGSGLLGRLRAQPLRAAWAALIVIACLAFVGTAAWVVGLQAYGTYQWRRAQQANERGDFGEARRRLDVCRNLWPNSGQVHFQLARACRRTNDFDAAGQHLMQAHKLHWLQGPIDLEYLLMQAQSGAIRSVEKTLLDWLRQGHAEETLILEAVVKGYLQVNLLGDAYRWSSIWLERHPEDWQPYYLRGLALERAWMLSVATQAAENFSRALELKPDLIDARMRLAAVLVRDGRCQEALLHLQLYREQHPDDPTAVAAVARCLRVEGKIEEAQRLLDANLSPNPLSESERGVKFNGDLCLVRGQLQLDQDRPKESLTWLLRPETLALNNVEVHHTLAQTYRRLGMTPEAEKHEALNRRLETDFRRLEEVAQKSLTDPKNVSLRHEAGVILLRHGQHQDAARWLLSALQDDPQHKPTHQALADLYTKMDAPILAAEHRRRAEE